MRKKIIYISKFTHEKYLENNKCSGLCVDHTAVQKYHKLMIDGLLKNGVDIISITTPPINRKKVKKKLFRKYIIKEKNIEYRYLAILNIHFLKNIFEMTSVFFNVMSIKKNETVLVVDVLNISIAFTALLASKIKRIKSVGIVTDLWGEYSAKAQRNFLSRFQDIYIKWFSSYILLTEEMNNIINKKNKPNVVIEGQVNNLIISLENQCCDKYRKKVCIYAGSLHKIYGIEMLIEGFLQANVEDSELHIYGGGDFEDRVIAYSLKYENIKYFGLKSNKFIVNEEYKATLLINPRPSNNEYTKYSFPSKNMEYMVSGTPILTTILPGMPREYYKYIYSIDDESEEGIAGKIHEVLNKPTEELLDFGNKAREFMLKEKNNIVQAKKIIGLIDGL